MPVNFVTAELALYVKVGAVRVPRLVVTNSAPSAALAP